MSSQQTSNLGAEDLFRAYAGFVANVLAHLGARGQDLDDLVQEVFLVTHRRGGYVPGPATPKTYLGEIALRVVQTRRRALRRQHVFDQDQAERLPDLRRPDVDAETRESLVLVQRALDALDVEKRALVILFELEGETCESIAAALGVPIGTVYSRLHHARRELTTAFERLTTKRKVGT